MLPRLTQGLGYEMFARLQLPVSEFVAMQSQRLVRTTAPHSPHLSFALFNGA